MDTKFIKEFILSVECGSVAKAANLTFSSPASISRHITALESELGVQLTSPGHGKLILTEAGEKFYVRYKDLLNIMEKFNASLSDKSQALDDGGHLSVSIYDGINFDFFRSIQDNYKKEFPNSSILFKSSESHNFLDLLNGSKCDIVLEANVPKELPKNITKDKISEIPFYLIRSKSADRDLDLQSSSVGANMNTPDTERSNMQRSNIQQLRKTPLLYPSSASFSEIHDAIRGFEEIHDMKFVDRVVVKDLTTFTNKISAGEGISIITASSLISMLSMHANIIVEELERVPIYIFWNKENRNMMISKFYSFFKTEVEKVYAQYGLPR